MLKSKSDIFKPVILDEFNDNAGIEEISEEFIQSLKECEGEIIGSERVGESIEFFDEDGSILLLVVIDEDEFKANFEFTLSEKAFDLSLSNIPDGIIGDVDEVEMEV